MYSKLVAVSLVLLLVGESSAVGPLRRRQQQCHRRQVPNVVPSATPAPVAPAAPVGGLYNLGSTGGNTANTGANTTTTAGGSLTGGTCSGFKNTVFNTGATNSPGFPSKTWTSLVGAGLSNWIGFSLRSISTKPSYSGVKTTPEFDSAQIPLMMDLNDVDDAYNWLTGPSPPPVLGLLNEPDFSFHGQTPTTDPATAGPALAKFFAQPHPKTKILSPAPADVGWLTVFQQQFPQYFQGPNGIDIISIHAYNPSVQVIVDYLKRVRGIFPNHPIWVTEVSPLTPGCSLTADEIVQFMKDLVREVQALGYVEKIFWNCGEQGASQPGEEGCNPSLTMADGSLSPLGQVYASSC